MGAEKGPELELRGWEIDEHNLGRLPEDGVRLIQSEVRRREVKGGGWVSTCHVPAQVLVPNPNPADLPSRD